MTDQPTQPPTLLGDGIEEMDYAVSFTVYPAVLHQPPGNKAGLVFRFMKADGSSYRLIGLVCQPHELRALTSVIDRTSATALVMLADVGAADNE